MTSVYLYSIGSVIIVSLISLIGIFTFTIREDLLKKYVFVMVSLAVGALLGDAFIHLIPETFAKLPDPKQAALAIIAGILVFFLLEKFLHWHHHGIEEESGAHAIHPVGRLVLISDGVHNFIDGLIIGVSYLASIEIGIATTIAVILHEIPQEIGDFGVLLHAGYAKGRALFLNLLSALLAVLGVIVTILFGEFTESFARWLLPVAAGGFIYIALSDLIPELHKTTRVQSSFPQIIAIFLGIGAMILLTLFE